MLLLGSGIRKERKQHQHLQLKKDKSFGEDTESLPDLRLFQSSNYSLLLILNELHCKSVPGFSLARNMLMNRQPTLKRICFIKCDVVQFRLDVWVYECIARQAEGSGSCCSVVLCLLLKGKRFLNESFHVKDATVNRL